jgi:hypothetical protein
MNMKLALFLFLGVAFAKDPKNNAINYENFFQVFPVGDNLKDDFKIFYNKFKTHMENFVESNDFEKVLKSETDNILLNHSGWVHKKDSEVSWPFPKIQTWNAAVIFNAIMEKECKKVLDSRKLAESLEKTKYNSQKN